ncbi:olfactory receptor 11A1-like isoform 2-T3 [Spinachia spinachia]
MMMMMMNSTHVSYFTLSAYIDTGVLRYFYFLIVMSLYVLIVCSNLLLIVVICMNRSLHEPMYLFLCSLFVNELFGSTGLFPFLMVQILSDVHTVAAPLCFLQIFCLFTYATIELLNLAVMSYDRYLAICCPLQYKTKMSQQKVSTLITLTWLLPVVSILVLISLSAPLRLCGNVIDRIYCGNYSVVKLACSDTRVNNIYGLVYTVVSVILPLVPILFSYMRILKILLSRLEGGRMPPMLGIVLSLYFLTCQPLFTPLLYGLNVSSIRLACGRLLVGSLPL